MSSTELELDLVAGCCAAACAYLQLDTRMVTVAASRHQPLSSMRASRLLSGHQMARSCVFEAHLLHFEMPPPL